LFALSAWTIHDLGIRDCSSARKSLSNQSAFGRHRISGPNHAGVERRQWKDDDRTQGPRRRGVERRVQCRRAAAKWNAIPEINLSAAFHGIAAAVPQMKAQHWGRIVNIASTHGLVASTHKAAYVAAKHGLVGLTKVVGLETAGSGVTCNGVCPGWVRTPLVKKQISDIAAQRSISQKEAVKELLAEKQPSLDFVSPA